MAVAVAEAEVEEAKAAPEAAAAGRRGARPGALASCTLRRLHLKTSGVAGSPPPPSER